MRLSYGKWASTCLTALLSIAAPPAALAQASIGPLYDIHATWSDTNLAPGGEGKFAIQVRNVGDEGSEEDLIVKDELPAAVAAVKGISFRSLSYEPNLAPEFCSVEAMRTVICRFPGSRLPEYLQAPGVRYDFALPFSPKPSGYLPLIDIDVEIAPGASSSGTEMNVAMAEGGGAPKPAIDTNRIEFSNTPAGFGVVPGSYIADFFDAAYPFGKPSRLAGDHPFEQRFNFDLTRHTVHGEFFGADFTASEPNAFVRTLQITLPRGLIGNPEALPKCDPVKFTEKGATQDSTACPAATQVGYLNTSIAWQTDPPLRNHLSRIPIYNLVPPKGTPIDLAFQAGGLLQGHIFASFDPAQGYAIKAIVPNIAAVVPVLGAEATLWGVPGDPAHERFRAFPEMQANEDVAGAPFAATIHPFLTNPMDCKEENGGTKIELESYTEPEKLTQPIEYTNPDEVTGCGDPRFRFEPEVSLQPTDRHAGAPTGLDVHLKVPQRSGEAANAEELYAKNGYVKGISTPPIKKAVVTIPEGMTLNPSAAQGLGSCTLAQIGIERKGGRYVPNDEPVRCPDSSQYGTLTIHTPLLPENNPLKGFIYIARQDENPFGSFLALYLVIEEPERGILFKIPGRLDLNHETGQITTTFDELPQFPVSDMELSLKGGVRAGLVNPSTCGKKMIRAEFFSWQDPTAPVIDESSYDIAQKPDGSPCVGSLAERAFGPQFDAGTLNPVAGSYSPFVMRLARTDDDQEFSQFGVTLPPGLAAKFAGVGICPDSGIAQALLRERVEGDGALELADPSCLASSQIGTTMVGVGTGVSLSWVPGKVYLAGPYKGAPISVAVISPAIVGPYDLGVITVRTALNVNPETAQGEASSDPFPLIFQGIPVRIRDIRLNLSREGFTLNPTSCESKRIEAHVTGTGGDLASTADDTAVNLANRFQVGDCARLGFKPSLRFHLYGGTHRAAHPRLKAVVRMPAGGANIAKAAVTLPPSEFLDQGHLNNICTRVQFAAKECPAASIYGHAVVKTPLFGTPLEGPVYLRSSSHHLPDLVAALKGPASEPVEVDLDARIDSVNNGIRNSFEIVPDAPVETFTLEIQGGVKGLLVNSTNLCAHLNRATAKFSAQNGKVARLHPVMQSSCAKKKKAKRNRSHHRH